MKESFLSDAKKIINAPYDLYKIFRVYTIHLQYLIGQANLEQVRQLGRVQLALEVIHLAILDLHKAVGDLQLQVFDIQIRCVVFKHFVTLRGRGGRWHRGELTCWNYLLINYCEGFPPPANHSHDQF